MRALNLLRVAVLDESECKQVFLFLLSASCTTMLREISTVFAPPLFLIFADKMRGGGAPPFLLVWWLTFPKN